MRFWNTGRKTAPNLKTGTDLAAPKASWPLNTMHMRKLLFSFLVMAATHASGQALFTLGTDTVTVPEFLQAYQKNNTGKKSNKSLRDYLQLFIASKLKIKEARSLGLDTSAQFRADLQALRSQIMPAYLNDPKSVDLLTEEALQRSQKDLGLAHIFISFEAGDTTAAFKKASEALAALRQGKAFSVVASQYSDDPAVQQNGGNLGFITVFSLPYPLESLAYNTPVGKLAPLYRSEAGYHILKVNAARPAAGRLQAAQILLAYPPGATNTEKFALRKKADSIYQALVAGADFGQLAERFSNDAISAGAGGQMPEFGVGQYDPLFEREAFALTGNGAISKPFETTHGIHILKQLNRLGVARTEAAKQNLRSRVQQSDRMETTRQQQVQRILSQAGYQPLAPTMKAALAARTRQEFAGNVPAESLGGNIPLFRLGSQEYTVERWLEWAGSNRFTADGSTEIPFENLWNSFVQAEALSHYQQYLEKYNPEFRQQMTELEEGNLFFEMMQRQVWNPAQNDTLALQAFYNTHKSRYQWQRSADAVLFYAGSKAIADKLAAQVQKDPARWQEWAAQYSADVTTDSARMEWGTLPGQASLKFAGGQVTSPQVNEADGTASFAYIIKTYGEPVQRSFEASRGTVINDYQAQKEKEWVETLKQKYPVKINEAALRKL